MNRGLWGGETSVTSVLSDLSFSDWMSTRCAGHSSREEGNDFFTNRFQLARRVTDATQSQLAHRRAFRLHITCARLRHAEPYLLSFACAE
jgi:hypothetical protein